MCMSIARMEWMLFTVPPTRLTLDHTMWLGKETSPALPTAVGHSGPSLMRSSISVACVYIARATTRRVPPSCSRPQRSRRQ